MLRRPDNRVSHILQQNVPWLIVFFLAVAGIMFLVWLFSPQQSDSKSTPKRQHKTGKRHVLAQRTIRAAQKEEKKDK
jgi:lysylphosphatidylglycerol synthetase-like protein (DUF2156 family)